MVSGKRIYMGRTDLFQAVFQHSLINITKKEKLRKNLYIINLIINRIPEYFKTDRYTKYYLSLFSNSLTLILQDNNYELPPGLPLCTSINALIWRSSFIFDTACWIIPVLFNGHMATSPRAICLPHCQIQ